MKNFEISTKAVWILVVTGLCISILGIYAESREWLLSQQLLSIGGSLFFTSWIIVMLELVNNKVYNRTFWILSMILAPFAMIFYLIQREKLFRLGESKFQKHSN
jgi:hypothetical protein